MEEDLREITDPAEVLRSIRSPSVKPKPKEGLENIRLRLAYRLARDIAQLNNWISDDQRLLELAENADDADEVPYDVDPYDVFWVVPPRSSKVQMVINPISPTRYLEAKHEGHPTSRANLKTLFSALTIIPHSHASREDNERWRMVAMELAGRLRLSVPIKIEDPNTRNYLPQTQLDEYETQEALTELLAIPSSWPSKEEIIAFEEHLIDFTIGLCLARTRQKAQNYLQTCVGLLGREIAIILALARQKACTLTAGDVEEKRAMMELALENLAERCRLENDRRTELGTYKALAVVQGIAKAEIEDDNALFSRVVKAAATGIAEPSRGRLLEASTSNADEDDEENP